MDHTTENNRILRLRKSTEKTKYEILNNTFMDTEQKNGKLLFADLTYKLNGLAIEVRKEIGRFGREKQYCDLFEAKLKEHNIPYFREVTIGGTGNRFDFVIKDQVLVEGKAKPFVVKEDYDQVQRYLYSLNLQLGIIYNFREYYVKPKRILRVK